MINFKDENDYGIWQDESLPKCFHKLKSILTDGAIFAENTLKKDIVITSIVRDDPPYNLHETYRAIDTRTIYPDTDCYALNWTDDEIKQLCDYINTKYPYDPNRKNLKTVLSEKKGQYGSTAPHLHWQILA